MAYTYIISEKYLKEETILHDNVDSKLVKVAIREAQDIYTRDVLGSALYDLIISELPSSLSTANATLVNTYVAPMQKYWSLKEIVINLQFKLANSAVLIREGENMRPVNADDLELLEKKYSDKAQYYQQRLIDFMCDNIADYPTYNSGNQLINPSKDNYSEGTIFLNDV